MTYTARQDYTFDTELFQRRDSQTALKIHHEYVVRHSARPTPKFFEVDRTPDRIDPLWHSSVAPRTLFTARSPISVPAINKFTKQSWVSSKYGRYAGFDDIFWLSRLGLMEHNYYPEAGDLVYWIGYRYQIVDVEIPADAYWTQTGVWMGLVCKCKIAPIGDAKPLVDLSVANPDEISPAISPKKEEDQRPAHIKNPLIQYHAFPE